MTSAKKLAEKLWNSFLTGGNFTLAGDRPASPIADGATQDEQPEDVGAFAGLQVHSVGYDPGDRDDGAPPAVFVYVLRGTRKVIAKLPQELDGVRVHVVPVGKPSVRPGLSGKQQPNVFEKGGRIACGSSCAPTGVNYTGTLGALLRDDKGTMFCLSNNHVFGDCNHMPVGTPILSPSNADGSSRLPVPKAIARFHKLVPMTSGNPQYVPRTTLDVGVADVIDSSLLTSWQGSENEGYETPKTVGSPSVGAKVKKVGRTTGLTTGRIQSRVQQPMAVPFVAEHFKATVWFEKLWAVAAIGEPFALPGDSGALVVSEDAEEAFGLLFAANPTGDFGWFIPLAHVLEALGGLSLVSGH